MKLTIVKIIDATKPEEQGWTRTDVARDWRPTTLCQIEKRDVIQIIYNGKHIRYLMKRTESEKRLKI